MSEAEAVEDGFTYEVSDEMLARFAQSSVLQRLEWLDEMQRFSWAAATPEVRAEWQRLRRSRMR
jgi:hypothetical protein